MKGVKVPVEVYSRVVGYFRPVAQWNNGKRMEFSERSSLNFNKFFNEEKNIPCNSN